MAFMLTFRVTVTLSSSAAAELPADTEAVARAGRLVAAAAGGVLKSLQTALLPGLPGDLVRTAQVLLMIEAEGSAEGLSPQVQGAAHAHAMHEAAADLAEVLGGEFHESSIVNVRFAAA